MLRLLRQISLPQLRASWGRTALVVGGIATGVTLIVAIEVINASVLANVRRTIELIAGPAALEVTLGVGEVGFPETTLGIVQQDPAVVAAVPLVRGTISLADGSGETLHLFGADLTAEEDLERYQGTAAAAVRRGIEARLGARFRLKILSLAEVLEYHDAYRRRAFAFTDAIQLLVVIVTIAGVFDLLLATIVERRRELAVWRLIGADDRSLRRAVMLESGTIGAVGAVLGIAVSAVTAWIWVRINFRQLLGYDLAFSFPLLSTAWYAALVLAMTVLAGYLAASRAVRSPILEGIQVD